MMQTKLHLTDFLSACLVLACCLAAGCVSGKTRAAESVIQAERLVEESRLAEEQGRLNHAVKLLVRAAKANPDDAEIHRQAAKLMIAQGRRDTAVEHLVRIVELTPDDPDPWVQLAHIWDQEREDDLMEQSLETALELDPLNADALYLKGRLEERHGQVEAASATYYRLLGIDPQNSGALLRLAALRLKSSNSGGAAPLLRLACQCPQVKPEQIAEAQWLLGIAYGDNRRWDDAVTALSAAMPNRVDATADDWYRLAYAHYRADEIELANSDLQTAIKLQPQHQNSLAMTRVLEPAGRRSQEQIILVAHTASVIPVPAGW